MVSTVLGAQGLRSLEFGSGPCASSGVGLQNALVTIYIRTNT